jgi:prepilin-type N-terminal cleavage/methylation domain-containing protein
MSNEKLNSIQEADCEGSTPDLALHAPHSKGFTLVEIVISIVLISILSGLAAMIIMQGVKAYSDEQSRTDVHYQARLAMERITREARLIQSCTAINAPANPSNTLRFTDIDGTDVTFTVNGGTKVLSRGADILATGVTSAQPFRFFKKDGATATTSCISPDDIWFVEIDLTDTQGAEALQMRALVHPRNF